tara:strand:- start:252 stop:1454 length:1203 start_codon:yes stop_codon:yes gene_type:complete
MSDLFEAYLDGAIEADDPRLDALPLYQRQQIERMAQAEATHKLHADSMVARRELVVRSLESTNANGGVTIPTGLKRARVLVINGVSMSETEWFKSHLFGIKTEKEPHQNEEDRAAAVAAWDGTALDHVTLCWAEDEAQARACQEAIMSGKYHAIVVCDLCLRDLLEEPECYFERLLGSRLQAFARAGGQVAFPTSDGLLLANMKMLNRMFDVTWAACAYSAESWGPLPALATSVFAAPATAPVEYTKASTLCGVPPEERICGAVQGELTIGEGGDFEMHEDFEAWSLRQGASAAVHVYGSGSIAYFGDTNCSMHNPPVVAAYCRSGFDRRQRQHQQLELGVTLARKATEEVAAGGTQTKRVGWSVTSAAAAAVLVGFVAYAFATALRDAPAIYAYATAED